jgi:hypothetical protein
LLVAIALLFSGSAYNGGCASTEDLNEDKKGTALDNKTLMPQEKEEDKISVYKIKIISKPSGSIIEVNNVYVGETPLTILTSDKVLTNICFDTDNQWSEYGYVNIKATPKDIGYTQSKLLGCKQLTQDLTIFFDMRLEPVNSK